MSPNERNQVSFGFSQVSPEEKTQKVQNVFDQSAEKYDIMNDIMSLGLHYKWKKKAIENIKLFPDDRILDLACGTCDLAYYLLKKQPKAYVVATDPNQHMIETGRDRLLDEGIYKNISFTRGFAEQLPFQTESFHHAICAFGLRNFTDQKKGIESLFRVLKPGGQLVILEFAKPDNAIIDACYQHYAQWIPTIGEWVSKEPKNYKYLIESIEKSIKPNALAQLMQQTGFETLPVTELLSGLVYIQRAIKC